jgi:ATP-dependent DNA helicase RecG
MDLSTPIEKMHRLAPGQKTALEKLGLVTVRDLLFHFPVRYGNTAEVTYISSITEGADVTIYGTVKKIKTGKAWKKKTPLSNAIIEDSTGKINATWFHQPYIAKIIQDGMMVKVHGKAKRYKDSWSFINPEIEPMRDMPLAVGDSLFGENGGEKDGRKEDGEDMGMSEPIYRESSGISSRWFHHTIQKIIGSGIVEKIPDMIPAEVLERYHLPSLGTALIWIHLPKTKNDALAARKRFAFQEVFLIQVLNEQERQRNIATKGLVIEKKAEDLEKFTKHFPFTETAAQKRAIEQILQDFISGHPMSRLLEGDVGSGKTAVAATTAYAAVTTRPKGQDFGTLQIAYMAPTEILAKQHFDSFIKYFSHFPLSIALITGSGCKKFPSKVAASRQTGNGATDISRAQLLKWVANGEIAIVIGTHALIQKTVKFKNLAYVIIDEQHRFGTKQRKNLRRKDDEVVPHLLSMTATPIPRTLALTVFGSLDLTLLDEMPAGRKPIITKVVKPNERDATYEAIRKELEAGRQAYIICPRINEPDPDKEIAVIAKSVKTEAERLQKSVFPEYEIDILHSKMTPAQKEATMQAFEKHETDILVATSVVEVGVNVPNATVILIEGAERFGLAQLHQLRGRVIRSNNQAYCYVFAESAGEKTVERLRALVTAKNGFELAEFDLQQRGTGDLMGRKQWGISDLAMEAMKNLKLVEAARTEARQLVAADPALANHQTLQSALSSREAVHFE